MSSFEKSVSSEESTSDELSEKRKQFRWTTEMVGDLIQCLKGYKAKMEFQGLDFDGDRPVQYKEVRKEMAKIYDEQQEFFGPLEILPSEKPLEELSKSEKDSFMKRKKLLNSQLQRGHQRVVEKVKEIRQNFSKAVTLGTRSGSGKIVYEFYEELISIWGGSPASKPLSFGVTSINEEQGSSCSNSCYCSSDTEQESNEDSQQGEGGPPVVRGVKRRAPENAVPKLIDSKRKYLEKKLSAAQRDQLLMEEAKQDKEIKRDLANAMRESTATFNTAMENISNSMNQMATAIGRSIEMLSQAMLTTQQPVNQLQPASHQQPYYANHGHGFAQQQYHTAQHQNQRSRVMSSVGDDEQMFYQTL